MKKSVKKESKKKLPKWILIIIVLLVLLACVWAVWVVTRAFTATAEKPAIYLYPTEDSFVSVNLDINGKITQDIPNYGEGWNVFATKEGIIDGNYDYLFYEARLNKLDVPEEGWVVEYSELKNWFDSNLNKLGLNEKESYQFKEYWLSRLSEANYYEIKLLSKEYLDENIALNINPVPDTLIRLEFYFKPLKESEQINEPSIITPERKGFTAVEWGGILKK
jgi:hypothetical protein